MPTFVEASWFVRDRFDDLEEKLLPGSVISPTAPHGAGRIDTGQFIGWDVFCLMYQEEITNLNESTDRGRDRRSLVTLTHSHALLQQLTEFSEKRFSI